MTHPLRILLVGNYEPDRQHSMLRYAEWLARALRQQGWTADLVAPPVRLGRFGRGTSGLRKWFGFIDKFVLFAFDLRHRARDYDLVHICDHSNAPYVLALGGTPVSLTCHDLIPIKVLAGEVAGENLSRSGRWLQRLIRVSLRQVTHLIFVSEATRADYVRLIKPLPAANDVIHNPVIGFGTMRPERARELMHDAGLPTDHPFLLHIGSNLWYKNRAGAVRLFGLLRRCSAIGLADARMICIGPALPENVVRQAADWREQLIVVNEPSHDLIEALYVSAQALLFPSLDEGFGWPIIEAQACGCPVITSDREPMRGIAGPVALLIDPDRLDEAAATIATRWDWLLAQRDAARTHAGSFSEAAAARIYADLLATFAGQRPAAPERAS